MAVPYTIERQKMMVRAKVGSQVGNFVLDTGAPCTLTNAFAKRAGITGGQLMSFSDSNGLPIRMRVTSLNNLVLGGINFMELQAVVLEPGNIMEQMGADGIIGYNLLRQGIVKFDSRQHLFILTDQRDSLNLDYNYCSELLPNSYVPLIPIRLGTQVDTVMFDSGAESLYEMSTTSYRRMQSDTTSIRVLGHGFGTLSAGAGGIEAQSEKWRLLAPTMYVGAAPFARVTTITTDADDSRIGFPLLYYGDVVIDYEDGFFYFMPHDASHTPDVYEPDWNVVPVFNGQHIVAGIVWNADAAGIQSGDRIVAFGNQRIDQTDMRTATMQGGFNLSPEGTTITYFNARTQREEQVRIRME